MYYTGRSEKKQVYVKVATHVVITIEQDQDRADGWREQKQTFFRKDIFVQQTKAWNLISHFVLLFLCGAID